MDGQTVKICLGLQIETKSIELRIFKTISDEDILAQKLQRDRKEEYTIHNFIAKYLKTETAKSFKITWKAIAAVSQQLKPISAQIAGVSLLFFCPQSRVSSPSFMRHQQLQREINLDHWVESGRVDSFPAAWLVLSQLAHHLQKVPIGPQQLKYLSASARQKHVAAFVFLVVYYRKNVAIQACKNSTYD